MTGLFIILGTVIFLLIVFTKTGRALGGMFVSLFVTDALKNPKAADAVYMQAIEEAQTNYSKASDALNQLQGQKIDIERKLGSSQAELKKVESDCDLSAKRNDTEALEILANKRAILRKKVESYATRLQELAPLVDEAKEIHKNWQLKINQLREQKELKVSELELSNNMNTLYAKMDSLRKDSTTDKMVGRIEENVTASKNRAAGAKMTYENQLTTQEAKMNDRLNKAENDEYIQSLLNKYKKS